MFITNLGWFSIILKTYLANLILIRRSNLLLRFCSVIIFYYTFPNMLHTWCIYIFWKLIISTFLIIHIYFAKFILMLLYWQWGPLWWKRFILFFWTSFRLTYGSFLKIIWFICIHFLNNFTWCSFFEQWILFF